MKYEIDIQKSKTNKRLKRKMSLVEIMSKYFLLTAWLIAFPTILGSMFFNAFNDNLTIQILFFSSLAISFLILYSILTMDKLRVINGLTPEKNKSISGLICNKLKWTNSKNNKDCDVFTPKWNWFSTHYGREVTVIYQGNEVLINSTTFLLSDLQSPFHWFADRRTEKKFKIELKSEIKKQRHANNG
jgi:hypothetical protein